MGMSNYQIPPLFDTKGDVLPEGRYTGWLREAVQEGNLFLKSQTAYEDLDRAAAIIAGPGESERIPKSLSRVYVNRIKRNIRENVAGQSNLRMNWAFMAQNDELKHQNLVLNKMQEAWWLSTFADRQVREAIQFANALGTGYASPVWEKDFHCYGRGDIAIHTYGPRDVLPIQLPRNNDLQKAYAVIIRTEAPLAMAHAMYPTLADRISPDRSQPGAWKRISRRVQRFLSPALNAADLDKERESNQSSPVVDIYNVYVMDLTLNMTGKVLPMGDPGTYWEYLVPTVGQDIPSGQFDSAGNALYRKAMPEDCLMFPLRRLMTCVGTRNMVRVKDGSSPFWHGKVPLVKFTVDDWPWEYLGFSPVRDAASIQASRTRLMRVIDDNANAKSRPPLKYDSQLGISQTLANSIDTRQPNQRIDLPMGMGPGMEPFLPADYYDVAQWIFNHLDRLDADIDFVMAVRDVAALTRARQMPSEGTIEKFFEVMGPIIQDMCRNHERPLAQLGDMWKHLAFEYYTTSRRVQILGEEGITPEDLQDKLGNMIPGQGPALVPYDYRPENMLPVRGATEAQVDYLARCRQHCNQFSLQAVPYSAHEFTQMAHQLMLLQWQKGGNPIDPWTMAKAFRIFNFGPEPKGTTNVMERWVAYTRMKGELMTEQAAEAQAQIQAAQGQAQLKAAAATVEPATPGRPPTGQVAPHLVQKEGGERTAVAESR